MTFISVPSSVHFILYLLAVYVENAFILGLQLYGYAALPYVRNVHLYAVHLGGCGVVYAQVGIKGILYSAGAAP